MKNYIFFFKLPDQTTLYITGCRNEVSINRFDAKEHRSTPANIDELKDYIQNGFNEIWDEKPEYSKQEIWKSVTLKNISLQYEEILTIHRKVEYLNNYPEDRPGILHDKIGVTV